MSMSESELQQVESYLRRRLNNQSVRVTRHAIRPEMGEVFLGEEFLGTIYRDTEDGEVTFDINITILQEDLRAL